MLADSLRAKTLLSLAAEVGDRQGGRIALVVDLSGIPGTRSRVVFRAFVRFIEERVANDAVRAQFLARNTIVLLASKDAADAIAKRLTELNSFLVSQRYGSLTVKAFDLADQAQSFVTYSIHRIEQAPPPPADRSVTIRDEAAPDIRSLGHIVDIDRAIGQADLSMQIRSQSIWSLVPGAMPTAYAEEIWVSIAAIERITGKPIHDDLWVFGKSTELLDQRVISYLRRDRADNHPPLFVNLNPSSVVGGAFRHLVDEMPAARARELAVEITLLNWRADPQASTKIADLLGRTGIRLALDGIQPAQLDSLSDQELAAADFLKIDAAEADGPALAAALAGFRGSDRLGDIGILCHCDSIEAIETGIKAGVRLFQGRLLASFIDDPAALERLLGPETARLGAQALMTAHAPPPARPK